MRCALTGGVTERKEYGMTETALLGWVVLAFLGVMPSRSGIPLRFVAASV